MNKLGHITAQAHAGSPLGPLLLAASARGLAGIWFEGQAPHPGPIDAPEDAADPFIAHEHVAHAQDEGVGLWRHGCRGRSGAGQAEADALLRGASAVSVKLAVTPGGLRIDHADLANPQLKASVKGSVVGSTSNLTVSAQLANLGLLYPQFPGAVIRNRSLSSRRGTVGDTAAEGDGLG